MVIKFITCAALTVLLLAGPVQALEKASQARQEEVARRGAKVMPFSLELTLHIFTKTNYGGIQQVIVKDPSDTYQIRLIREHLRQISKEFAQRNFSAPAGIHGSDMQGLKELEKARPGQLRIAYSEIPKGAQIDYSSNDPALIDAIHRWFDAQLADHAGYAVPGHVGHQIHKE